MTVSGWQPIETAPKDGTPFLIYEENLDYPEESQTVVRWKNGHFEVCAYDAYTVDNGTHWTPLLPNPSKTEPLRPGEYSIGIRIKNYEIDGELFYDDPFDGKRRKCFPRGSCGSVTYGEAKLSP